MIIIQTGRDGSESKGQGMKQETYVVPYLSLVSLGSLTEAMRRLHQPELCELHVDAKNCAHFLEAKILGAMLMTLPACTLWQSIDFGKDLTVAESLQLLGQMRAQHRDVTLFLHPPP